MIEQDFDLRHVTRKSGPEVVAEYRLVDGIVQYRILGSQTTFGADDVTSERRATIECPCSSCAGRRAVELRMRIAADAVRKNPMSMIITDGISISNPTRATQSATKSSSDLLDALVSHLRYVVTDVSAAMEDLSPQIEAQP